MRFGVGEPQHLLIARDDRDPLDVGCCDQKAVARIATPEDGGHFGCFKGYSTRQVRELVLFFCFVLWLIMCIIQSKDSMPRR
jgi:hypothetical protein